MSRYRKTMSEAMAEVEKIAGWLLEPKMNPRQIQNIKRIWQFKTKKDVTPAVIKMIKNMDPVTQSAIKDAYKSIIRYCLKQNVRDRRNEKTRCVKRLQKN